jgi:hypothetical protein
VVVGLGEGFGLPYRAIELAVSDLGKRCAAAKRIITRSSAAQSLVTSYVHDLLEKRWNETFTSIGRRLSAKLAAGAKRKKSRKSDWQP